MMRECQRSYPAGSQRVLVPGEVATGSCTDATGPMDASGATGSVVVAGDVGSGCCGNVKRLRGSEDKVIQRLSAVMGALHKFEKERGSLAKRPA